MIRRQHIAAHSLSPAAYAPYGDVLMAMSYGQPGRPANQGTARRFDHLAGIENLRPGRAALNVSVFRCSPAPSFPFPLALLERHPGSTQAFVPMNAHRYLVVVALGGDRPDLATLAAFVARGAQGITYRPGVWHHPMIALDAETDFVCLAWEDGSPGDCDVVELAEGERVTVELPP
ncbi:ureidoglycolate hydrolase [Sorangium cellulosum]|uniref:Ureidoglycolate hydrolase n=1 Tax=Sorangium cellulosum TaxID=56 RepID=A0A2L0EIY1_SORCE|nr:ureidoglycolate lyase [Sorangium cellulosum]AUX39261.1 ureidoglycolate hydrolase [Sorangium cellulosum]